MRQPSQLFHRHRSGRNDLSKKSGLRQKKQFGRFWLKSNLFRFPGLSKVRRGWSYLSVNNFSWFSFCSRHFLVTYFLTNYGQTTFSARFCQKYFHRSCWCLNHVLENSSKCSSFFLSCLQFLFSIHFSSEAGAATYLEKIFADKMIVWFLLKVKHFLEHDYFVEMELRGLAL